MAKLQAFVAAALALSAAATSGAVVKRQSNNEVYQGHESEMTAAQNATLWLVPIKREDAQKMAGDQKLLKPAGLESYLHSDEHVLLISSGYLTDIRQLDLRVDQLRDTSVALPFVDATGDGKTPVNKQIINYQDQVIPALVGTIAGDNAIIPSVFDPPHAPYKSLGSGSLSDLVSVGLDNRLPVLGGPGYLHPVFQTTFARNSKPSISAETFKKIINFPQTKIVGNRCAQPQYLTNYTQAEPFFVKASDFETYPPTTPSDMSIRDRVEGYSATVMWIYPAGLGSPCEDLGEK